MYYTVYHFLFVYACLCIQCNLVLKEASIGKANHTTQKHLYPRVKQIVVFKFTVASTYIR